MGEQEITASWPQNSRALADMCENNWSTASEEFVVIIPNEGEG
jgi:hypothetical protein